MPKGRSCEDSVLCLLAWSGPGRAASDGPAFSTHYLLVPHTTEGEGADKARGQNLGAQSVLQQEVLRELRDFGFGACCLCLPSLSGSSLSIT